MTDISKIKIGENEYDLKDTVARELANNAYNRITYGYTDLIDGTDSLATGTVYFYIESESGA